MYPELFELPIVHITVKSYGTMMVIGFLMAVWLMRRLARKSGHNPDAITNAALYALISGVVGARLFYVIHYFDHFKDNLLSVFATWNGGLEYLGGVFAAIVVLLIYLYTQKMPVRQTLDILVIGLMLGLAFGRIGCFLNGCCYGRPTDCPMGIHFPYHSPAYISQAYPDEKRDRYEPQLELPKEYFGIAGEEGTSWHPVTRDEDKFSYPAYLKPKDLLTPEEKEAVTHGQYRCRAVHPTQIYSSGNGFILCGILLLFWSRFRDKWPGATMGLMFILYGATRFGLEILRDDNPHESAFWTLYKGGTVSQNLGIYMIITGILLMILFSKKKT
jgi:phosphatidylglycerol:prolipoprotein diacylglycerol transferase